MTSGAARARSEGTRARLRAAALAAFAERGFHGTTTRDIAAGAGMSPGAMYVHHSSKEELLYLISRAGHEQTLDLVRTAMAGADEPSKQLAAVMRAFARYHAEQRTSARVVNYELAALGEEHLREILAQRRAIDAEMRELVQRGVDCGEFDTSTPQLAANAVLSLGIDVARWYHEDAAWTPEQIGSAYADLALRMVGARTDTPKS